MLATLLLSSTGAVSGPAFDALTPRLEAIQASDSPTAPKAASEAKALAEKLSNPIAALISVPIQFNFDDDIGPGDQGRRTTINMQPVVPFEYDEDWNLISRTIVPFVIQEDVDGATDQSGLGDVVQSLFLSPKKPGPGGWIWGVGPVFSLPTATGDLLGSEKWGVGPTAIFLKQGSGWTYGALVNHIWSVAGDDDRADINSTFLQPFVAHTTSTAWTFSLNTESTYDWERDDWAVPANFVVSKLIHVGLQPISFAAGVRYWADSAPDGPEGFGFRFVITPLFPK